MTYNCIISTWSRCNKHNNLLLKSTPLHSCSTENELNFFLLLYKLYFMFVANGNNYSILTDKHQTEFQTLTLNIITRYHHTVIIWTRKYTLPSRKKSSLDPVICIVFYFINDFEIRWHLSNKNLSRENTSHPCKLSILAEGWNSTFICVEITSTDWRDSNSFSISFMPRKIWMPWAKFIFSLQRPSCRFRSFVSLESILSKRFLQTHI